MSIRLVNAIRIAGSEVAAGTTLTLDDASEADQVNRGNAVWVSRKIENAGYPVMSKTDPVTGRIAKSNSGGVETFNSPTAKLTKVNNVGARGIFGSVVEIANDASGLTYNTAWALESAFDAIQLVFANPKTSGTVLIGPVKVSTAATVGDGNNSAGTWTNVTFSGATTVTLPNATDANDPTLTLSDWIPISSLARSDVVGGLPLLFARMFLPAATTLFPINFNTGITSTGWSSKSDGRIRPCRKQVGDAITTPSAFTSTTETSGCPIYAVRYRARGRVVSVASFGDSIGAGASSGGGTLYGDGHIYRACTALSTLSSPVQLQNMGWGGQTSAQILARAIRAIPVLKPDVAIYSAFTPNDGLPTAETNNAARQRVAQFYSVCADYGVVPVILNGIPMPASTPNVTQDGFRKKYNSELAAFSQTIIVDQNSAIGDGALPEGIISGKSGDGLHPNDAGYELMTVPVKNALLSIGNF